MGILRGNFTGKLLSGQVGAAVDLGIGIPTPTPTPLPLPSWTVQPSISGAITEGQTLTGNPGTISNGSVSARQWLRNGSAISGANGATYLLAAADVGANISFQVTASGAGGSAQATSASVGPIVAAANGVAPTISGTPAMESTLTFADGTSSNVTARRLMQRTTSVPDTDPGTDSGFTVTAGSFTLDNATKQGLAGLELSYGVQVGGTWFQSPWTAAVQPYWSQSLGVGNPFAATPNSALVRAPGNPAHVNLLIVEASGGINRLNPGSNVGKQIYMRAGPSRQDVLFRARSNRTNNFSPYAVAYFGTPQNTSVLNSLKCIVFPDSIVIHRVTAVDGSGNETTANLGNIPGTTGGAIGLNRSGAEFRLRCEPDPDVNGNYRFMLFIDGSQIGTQRSLSIDGATGEFTCIAIDSDQYLGEIGSAGYRAGQLAPVGSSDLSASSFAFDKGDSTGSEYTVNGIGTGEAHEFRVINTDTGTVLADYAGSFTSFPARVRFSNPTRANVKVQGRPVGSDGPPTSETTPARRTLDWRPASLGMGPQGQDWYFVEHPFANLARINSWRVMDGTQGGRSVGRGVSPISNTGHPLSLPSGASSLDMYLARCRTPGANCIIEWAGGDNTTNVFRVLLSNGTVVTPTVVGPNKLRFAYLHSWTQTDSAAQLRMIAINSANPPTNLRVYQEDMGDVLFQPQAVARYAQLSNGAYIRSMDLANTNNPREGQGVANDATLLNTDVGDLSQPEWLQVNGPYGISDKDFIKFCVAAGKNAWINIKVGETEAATRARLALYRDGFTENGTLYKVDKIKIEAPGNEPWNETFGRLKRRVAAYHLNQPLVLLSDNSIGVQGGFSQNDVVFGQAKKMIEVSTIINDMFAGQMNRVQRTVSVNLVSAPNFIGVLMSYTHPNGQKASDHIDSFCVNPYFGNQMQGDIVRPLSGSPDDYSDWTNDFATLIARMGGNEAKFWSCGWILGEMRKARAAAEVYGKQVDSYEGISLHFSLGPNDPPRSYGLDTVPFPGGAYTNYLGWFRALSRQPGWQAVIREFAKGLADLGGDHNGFVMMQYPDNYGAFQFIENESVGDENAPKWQGYREAVTYANAL